MATTSNYTECHIDAPSDMHDDFIEVVVNVDIVNSLFFSCRIIMRNFLRIRDGDRFWYERYLSEEVLICKYLV